MHGFYLNGECRIVNWYSFIHCFFDRKYILLKNSELVVWCCLQTCDKAARSEHCALFWRTLQSTNLADQNPGWLMMSSRIIYTSQYIGDCNNPRTGNEQKIYQAVIQWNKISGVLFICSSHADIDACSGEVGSVSSSARSWLFEVSHIWSLVWSGAPRTGHAGWPLGIRLWWYMMIIYNHLW